MDDISIICLKKNKDSSLILFVKMSQMALCYRFTTKNYVMTTNLLLLSLQSGKRKNKFFDGFIFYGRFVQLVAQQNYTLAYSYN